MTAINRKLHWKLTMNQRKVELSHLGETASPAQLVMGIMRLLDTWDAGELSSLKLEMSRYKPKPQPATRNTDDPAFLSKTDLESFEEHLLALGIEIQDESAEPAEPSGPQGPLDRPETGINQPSKPNSATNASSTAKPQLG